MMKNFKILLLFFVVEIGYVLQADAKNLNFNFRSVEVENGLSQNMVYSILQDQQGFMWFGTQDGLNRFDGIEFKIYKKNKRDPGSIGSNAIFSLLQNKDGKIWVGTANGVYLYNPVSESFAHLKAKTIRGIVRDIKKDRYGNIWMAVSKEGLFCYTISGKLHYYPFKAVDLRRIEFDTSGNVWLASYSFGLIMVNPKTARTTYFHFANDTNDTESNSINDLYFLNTSSLLVGTVNKGVQLFDLKTHRFIPYIDKGKDGNPLFVRRIYRSDKSHLWIGTETGLYIYNILTRTSINLRHIFNDPYSISDNAIHSIYRDREGGMWVGTFFGGANYCADSYSYFEKYYPVNGENSISGKSISEMCEDDAGHIWIGTEDAGLNMFDPANKIFTRSILQDKNIHSLLIDKGQLWVGTFSKGLLLVNLKTGNIRSYRSTFKKNSLCDDNIYSIYKDGSGVIWIGSMMGLQYYNPKTDDFVRVQEHVIRSQVNDILEDYKGILWFATIGNGLFSLDRHAHRWMHYIPSFKDNDFVGKAIVCLLQDHHKRIWAGTEGGGLCLFDRRSNSFKNIYSTENGLPDDVIYKLLEDSKGHIWGSTNNGLFKLNPEKGKITTYTYANGLLGNQFNYKSGLKSRNGKLYFGGVKGFVAFDPNNLTINTMMPPVVINSFQIQNKEVSLCDKGTPLKQAISYTREITLPHRLSSVLSIGFAALSYVFPQGNHYAYKLEGKDKDWIYTNDLRHQVNYSALPPGTYLFKVKASNNDGVWNNEGRTLKINILPPFYKTFWAYLLYVVLVLSVIGFIIKSYLDKVKRQNIQFQQELERDKEKELYSAKIDFFTHITHEIRNPLSLIKAPLEEIIRNADKTNRNWENLSIMQRNVDRLLKLVNELLDFRKAESKGLNLNFVRSDVISIIKETIDEFVPTLSLKEIALDINIPESNFYADVDPEILTKILSNVFANALNHADRLIEITFSQVPDKFILTVSNDGDLIPTEHSEKIFEPFFKLNPNIQGSGLGLPVVRSLLELHGGSISYDKFDRGKNTFIIELPVHQENCIRFEEDASQPDPMDEKDPLLNEIIKKGSKKTILLVEDNEEFQEFLSKQLVLAYGVLKAQNGEQALEMLHKQNVDMVISDIVMPKMNGLTLCKNIKENINFSHIPVIILTAKTAMNSKIEGLKNGADEYIEKPYSIEYLVAKIESIFETRKKISEAYKHAPELAYTNIVHSRADEEFLNKLIKIIESRLEDGDLDVDQLAGAMNISRATFYRKLSSISELTPNEFILLVRLKKAAELLQENDYRINEIAYIVGFSSSSYFSKCFYKQFGVLPKNFSQKHKPDAKKDLDTGEPSV
ncbi:MAG: two-component regulator propeller domain-containing protein [Bacteroidota bacterium]|nr:two-component regulator propeller domain-containing protein [Bacteroidota bacterium]